MYISWHQRIHHSQSHNVDVHKLTPENSPFTITCSKSTVSLLESREQHCTEKWLIIITHCETSVHTLIIIYCASIEMSVNRLRHALVWQDGDILASYYPPSVQVAYILSLGVVGDFRRNGIGMCLRMRWKAGGACLYVQLYTLIYYCIYVGGCFYKYF